MYDESAVTFESLLDVFWAKHDPTSKDRQGADSGTQYRAGIYTTTDERESSGGSSGVSGNQGEGEGRREEGRRCSSPPFVPPPLQNASLPNHL